jgi:hypothetical protein
VLLFHEQLQLQRFYHPDKEEQMSLDQDYHNLSKKK